MSTPGGRTRRPVAYSALAASCGGGEQFFEADARTMPGIAIGNEQGDELHGPSFPGDCAPGSPSHTS
ncbi:hypothetical protein [Streptomyces sp. NPDC005283]|uniref:hypothetical protein n=1 Tax=Streptomyces sp. NPDC005283 TaxID=3156871 RepID=UPI003453C232